MDGLCSVHQYFALVLTLKGSCIMSFCCERCFFADTLKVLEVIGWVFFSLGLSLFE